MKPQKSYTIKNAMEYVAFINRFKNEQEVAGNNAELLFRGQGLDKPLLPKIARLNLRLDKEIAKTESLIMEEFKRGILPLSEFKPENNWDLLALAQHHGLPTRLLDWTYNALAALWFAVENPAVEENGEKLNAVVWILAAENDDFRTNTSKIDPMSNKITKIFRSQVVSRRISAQSGVFTVHKIANKKIYKFETVAKFKHKLTKLIIKPEHFSIIRKELNILGVNNFSIYPDLDGFCKHLSWRFSKKYDE
ncbi:MAG: FRG domain-containing protein [Saprospiraceae bacterium]